MKIMKLDKTGHTTLDVNVQEEFNALIKQGYAMFLSDTQIKTLDGVPEEAEILALAPLVGG